jgi:NAD(P)-dependent dehydrogenase (short-subunit alcohol dehydrogenase family)
MIFENQTILVSGAGRGIGKEIALSFAREGANIETLADEMAPIAKKHQPGLSLYTRGQPRPSRDALSRPPPTPRGS